MRSNRYLKEASAAEPEGIVAFMGFVFALLAP